MKFINQSDLHNELAKQLSKALDNGFCLNMLVESGWYKITINDLNAIIDIVSWLHNNCKHRYEIYGKAVVFENIDDAAWFALRWS